MPDQTDDYIRSLMANTTQNPWEIAHNGQWPTQASAIYPTQSGNAISKQWPDQNDAQLSQKYDALYGSPLAAYATPGAAYIQTMSPTTDKQANAYANRGLMPTVKQHINDADDAERIRKEALATSRSAVMQLGYDPSHLVRTPWNEQPIAGAEGRYYPNVRSNNPSDQRLGVSMVGNLLSTAAHEAAHAGLEKLRRAGLIDPSNNNEELIVRALMQKHFGDIEIAQHGPGVVPGGPGYEQVKAGRNLKDNPQLDELEKIASEYIARKHPGGPR